MKGTKRRDPDSEALIEELVLLTGPEGFDQSDREIEAEMEALDVKVSHERIRQCRKDDWGTLNRSTRRNFRVYVRWKRSNGSIEDAKKLAAAAAKEMAGHRAKKGKADAS